MQKATNIQQLFDDMPRRWLPEKSAGIRAIIQLELTGDDAQTAQFHVNDGALDVKMGPVDNANLTLTASAADYMAISNGELDAVKAFMQGRLKAKGDL
ncbi:MAG TPA: SCP2 sterol-binding domain-containing protein, partial [Anaerolineales bacterium]|nr:SCP2 sterol-binding domain-containing protein [Anaerolineales bacterium]